MLPGFESGPIASADDGKQNWTLPHIGVEVTPADALCEFDCGVMEG